MKVLFVCSGNAKQGISQIVLKQGNSLQKLGVDLTFFTVKGKGARSYLKAARELRQYLKENPTDIIHAHFALCGLVSWLAHRKEKLVISFMGSDVLGINTTDGKFTQFGKWYAWFNRTFHRYTFDYLIVKSGEMARTFGRTLSNLSIIPNGVDMDDFCLIDKEEAFRHTAPSITPQPFKRHVLFISNPSRNEKNFPLAEQAVQALGRDDVQLTAVHSLSISDLKFYYAVSDVVIMTSFHEGSPNVIKEALATNCNVVCTDVGDVKELFGDLPNCWITSHDVDDVRFALDQALSRPREMNQSRAFILSIGLDDQSVAQRIVDIYTKLN